MSELITSLLPYLLLYKYVALFLIAYIAALLIPLPSNTTLLAAAAFASQGYLNIYIVILVALIANVLGDMSGFAVAHRYGKSFLYAIGLRKAMASKRYMQLEGFIITNQRVSIFVTRFFGGVGPLVNILSGISTTISFGKFCLYGISGEIVYVLSLALPGYFLGSQWQDIMDSFQYVSIGIICVITLFVVRKIYMYKLGQ
jgi:membrane protein DedA with SNARE-associated domain